MKQEDDSSFHTSRMKNVNIYRIHVNITSVFPLKTELICIPYRARRQKTQIPVEGGISNEEKYGNTYDCTYPGFYTCDGSECNSI